jgi:hypothetical protein
VSEGRARPLARRRRAEATALPAWIKPQLTNWSASRPMSRSGCTSSIYRFSRDSPLEGTGFEISVPGGNEPADCPLTGCERGVANAPARLSARLYPSTQATLTRHRPGPSVAHREPRSRRYALDVLSARARGNRHWARMDRHRPKRRRYSRAPLTYVTRGGATGGSPRRNIGGVKLVSLSRSLAYHRLLRMAR